MSVKQFKQKIRCPACGHWFPNASPLSLWIRNHPQLDPQQFDLGVTDIDFLMHRFKVLIDNKGSRTVQRMMFVEAKTNGNRLDERDSQYDTLRILNEQIRTKHYKRDRDANGHFRSNERVTVPAVVWSPFARCNVQLHHFGVHLLELSGATPGDGEIFWDRKSVTVDQLLALLRMDLDPDTLKEQNDRRRKRRDKNLKLFNR